jgi:hypothetical protein
MKFISEIEEWCAGAAAGFENPAEPVGQMFARFVSVKPQRTKEIVAAWEPLSNEIAFTMPRGWLPLEVNIDGPQIDPETQSLTAFGLELICPGLWTLRPSLHIPGQIHMFVTIYDVPIIAPWEKRIITVSRGF